MKPMSPAQVRPLLVVGVAAMLVAGCSSNKHALPKDAAAGKGGVGGSRADASAGPKTPEGGTAKDSGVTTGHAGSNASSSADAGQKKDAGKTPDAASTPQRDAAPQGASTGGGGKLCPELGWCELTDTKLAAVCPDSAKYAAIQANEGCSGVINDWSGGIADEKRNWLLIWGGGHRGYFGNEVYVLDLKKVAMRRLNDPSDLSGIDLSNCTSPEAYADGRPSSRHTYDGLAYFPEADKMFSVAGAGIPCGYAVTGTWTLDLSAVETAPSGAAAPWTNMSPSPYPTKASYGVVADYDPNTKQVILDDTYSLWSYDLVSNKYALLNDTNKTNAHIDYHMTGRVDPKRKLFVIVGGKSNADGGMQVFDISQGSAYAQQNWTNQVSGCDALMAASSPGLAYDPVQDRLVGWAGGDAIHLFDPDAKQCTTVSHGGGPTAQQNGTFGRFRYFPALKLFAVVNDIGKNAYTLRLTP